MVSIYPTKLYSVYEKTKMNQTRPYPSYSEPQFQEKFSKRFILDDQELEVNFLIIPLDESYFIWAGVGPKTLNSLAVGMMTSLTSGPLSTSILGKISQSSEDEGSSLRLAKKTNSVIFFSTSFGIFNRPEVRIFAEKVILDCIKH